MPGGGFKMVYGKVGVIGFRCVGLFCVKCTRCGGVSYGLRSLQFRQSGSVVQGAYLTEAKRPNSSNPKP